MDSLPYPCPAASASPAAMRARIRAQKNPAANGVQCSGRPGKEIKVSDLSYPNPSPKSKPEKQTICESEAGFKFRWQRAVLDSGLPTGVKTVLLVICSYMRVDGVGAYPTIETIARDASLSAFRAGLHVQAAVDAGWITRWERGSTETLRGRAAQGWRHYQYAATIPNREPDPPAAEEEQEIPERVGTEGARPTYEPAVSHTAPSADSAQGKEENIPTIRGELTLEGPHDSWKKVPTIRGINNQVNNQELQTGRGCAPSAAPVAACAAPARSASEKRSKKPNPAAMPRRGKKGTRFDLTELPDAWEQWAQEFCRKAGLDLDVRFQFRKFRDYWIAKAGKDAIKLDWFAVWRTWWRREYEHALKDPRKAAAMAERQQAEAAKARRAIQEEERHRAAIEQAERERQAASERAAQAERAAQGLTCGNCLHLGGNHAMPGYRSCEFLKPGAWTKPDRAPNCEHFSRRPNAPRPNPANQAALARA